LQGTWTFIQGGFGEAVRYPRKEQAGDEQSAAAVNKNNTKNNNQRNPMT